LKSKASEPHRRTIQVSTRLGPAKSERGERSQAREGLELKVLRPWLLGERADKTGFSGTFPHETPEFPKRQE